MKITFLGVSSALSKGYDSSILIDADGKTLLFDCGEDIKHSIRDANRDPSEIDSVYISHLHSDHCGGMSWLAYYSYFVTQKKIRLYIHESMVSDLWSMLRPAMEKVNGQRLQTLSDYFHISVLREINGFDYGDLMFFPIRQNHVVTEYGDIPSYGVKVYSRRKRKWLIFITSDVQEVRIPIEGEAFNTKTIDFDYIFSDCDVLNIGGAHPKYTILRDYPEDIKKKMWLYHYTNLRDQMPDAVKDGFAGFVKQGQIFEIEA